MRRCRIRFVCHHINEYPISSGRPAWVVKFRIQPSVRFVFKFALGRIATFRRVRMRSRPYEIMLVRLRVFHFRFFVVVVFAWLGIMWWNLKTRWYVMLPLPVLLSSIGSLLPKPNTRLSESGQREETIICHIFVISDSWMKSGQYMRHCWHLFYVILGVN